MKLTHKLMTIATALLLGGSIITGATVAGADNPPHCTTGVFTENSGNGPTYHNVHYCSVNRFTNYMIVDGGPLQNGATIFGQHVSDPNKVNTASTLAALVSGAPLSRTVVNSLPNLAGCFNQHGVQLSTHISYECIDQSVPGGALYWSANESNFNWDKHPDSGLLWLEASTLHPATDANPPNNKQAFWVGIGHQGSFCSVVNPGYNEEPTMCALPGQLAHTMTARQQATYDQFESSMESINNIPDCAWSMTIVSDQCDIDS